MGNWSCDWGVWLFRLVAFHTRLVGTTGGAVGRPQADGHQEGGDKTKHLHKTPPGTYCGPGARFAFPEAETEIATPQTHVTGLTSTSTAAPLQAKE